MQRRYFSRPNCFSTLPERSDEADKYYWIYYGVGGGLDSFGLLKHGTDGRKHGCSTRALSRLWLP
ncbi:hypothetical protein AGR13a_Lc90140 [Agrobacterium genomosp. 13 str. CFBP 6927]|uniref:Uncharacterized protein n=1 Tax=Agrobacterium genomosp. 13 str. CFBP 6927 TaxID=1183428 RepID=A0ABP2BPR3_9HYPH|nr:hypothetical protein AGR13a_Lc90140 [Agrobacterium genomosp. 13 str. CFBP 6927]